MGIENMDYVQFNSIVSFIWGIADDCLRDVYVRGKYRDVILPMTVIRRLDAFFKNEVLPFVPDAWINEKQTKIGYELSFTKYFYKPVQLRSPEDIAADLRKLEEETAGLLDEILGGRQ